MKTTLNKIRAHSPCSGGWKKLLSYLGKAAADDEPLPISTILKSNGLDDAFWCLRAVDGRDREKRLLAVKYARQVQHLMADPKSIFAIDVAERFANGEASAEELAAARDAAWAVWSAANAAGAAARAARDAVWSAANAAGAAAWAARDAAWAAASAAGAAAWAARDAAWAAASAAGAAAWAVASTASAAMDAASAAAWEAGDAALSARDAASAAARAASRDAQEKELLRICAEVAEQEGGAA